MSDRLVVVITGPAGSGKSTVAAQLSKQITKCVNIDADHVKHFIVNGFIYDKSVDGIKQWELLGENIGMLAKNFSSANYNIIINGYLNEPAWHTLTQHIKLTHKFLLLPDLKTSQQRNKMRREDLALSNKDITEHRDYFSSADYYADFFKINSTDDSPEETTQKIKEHIGKNRGEL